MEGRHPAQSLPITGPPREGRLEWKGALCVTVSCMCARACVVALRSIVLRRSFVRSCFHFISFHFISFHFISFHFISFHFISFHFISFHFISFHFISFHFISFHFHLISLHFISFISFHSHTSLECEPRRLRVRSPGVRAWRQ